MLKTVKVQKETDKTKSKAKASDKSPQAQKNVPPESNPEKDFLQGEEHISENDISNNLEKSVDSNEQETEQDQQEDLKNKNIIELKPRETYLKDKIGKMNFDQTLLSSINKGMKGKLNLLKDEILNQNVVISDEKKNINKSFDFSSDNNLKKDNYDTKMKYREIKELNEEKNALNRKLMQIIENENLLEGKNKNNSELLVEQNLKEKIKKDVSKQKKEILDKIDLINSKIKLTMQNLEDINSKRYSNLKNFIDNFERDKEIAEIRAKKYLKETNKRKKEYFNSINQIEKKIKKEIYEKEQKEKENKIQYVLKLKKQARDLESKQSKKTEEKSLLYKPYMKQKNNGPKNYLFMKQYQKYINNEKKLLDKEKNFRKNYMKHISNEEIDEFNSKMEKKREEKKLISEEKIQKLHQEWLERKKTVPTYVSPFLEKAYEDITNDALEEKTKNEQRSILNDKMNTYSTEVRNSRIPKKDKTLELKRLELINNLDQNRFLKSKETLKHHQRKGRILLKKPDPNKPNKFDWLKALNKSSENDINIEEKLIKRPKNYMLSMSYDKSRNKLPSIKNDYLKEMNNKTKETLMQSNNDNDNENNKNINYITQKENYVKASSKKWAKLINQNNSDSHLLENITKAKNQIENLEHQKLQNEKLLIIQKGANQNNAALNQKVSNLIIDSIQAKITLLNQMK